MESFLNPAHILELEPLNSVPCNLTRIRKMHTIALLFLRKTVHPRPARSTVCILVLPIR